MTLYKGTSFSHLEIFSLNMVIVKDFEIMMGLKRKKKNLHVSKKKEEEKDGLFVDKTVDILFLTSWYPFFFMLPPLAQTVKYPLKRA